MHLHLSRIMKKYLPSVQNVFEELLHMKDKNNLNVIWNKVKHDAQNCQHIGLQNG